MSEPIITYQDISPTAKEDAEYSASNVESYDDLTDLNNATTDVKNVATLEWNFWKLDGNKKLFPDDASQYEWGMISSTLSDSEGVFADDDIPILVVAFDDLQTSVAITCDFDKNNDEYPTSVQVIYYSDETVLDDTTYDVTSSTFAFVKEVESYNKIEIRILETNCPYRRGRINNIYFGIIRTFTNDELEELSVLEEVNPISTEISINQMNFSVRNTSEIPFLFQKMQPLVLKYGSSLIGQFFINSSKRKNKNFYEIECIDNIGILDKSNFYGGMYSDYSAKTLLDDILGNSKVSYSVDSTFDDVTVTGYIPICTKREALLFVCFAIGAVADTSRSTNINILSLDSTVVKTFTELDTYLDGSVDIDSKVTKVSVTAYSYLQSATESTELYNGVLPEGTNRITFDNPYYGYTISGGTIVTSHVNYCDILADGSSTVILYGYEYKECTTVYSKSNPSVNSTDVANEKECSSCTLVNTSNVESILSRIYAYFTMTETVNTKVVLDDVSVGDTVVLPTIYDEDLTCILTSITLSFGNKIVGEVTGIAANNE